MPARSVALLRGINVGTAKRIGMAELRSVLVDLGYTGVITHLQSGNVVFTSSAAAARTAAKDIERSVHARLGVRSTVVMRSAAELAAVIANAPLLDVMTDPSRFLVGFLSGDPNSIAVRNFRALDVAPDQIRIRGREVYMWCPGGVIASPLTKLVTEKSLGVAVTMRNWNTVTRLAALAGAQP